MKNETTQDLLNEMEELGILNVSACGKLDKESLSIAVELTKDAYSRLDFTELAKRIDSNVENYTRR